MGVTPVELVGDPGSLQDPVEVDDREVKLTRQLEERDVELASSNR